MGSPHIGDDYDGRHRVHEDSAGLGNVGGREGQVKFEDCRRGKNSFIWTTRQTLRPHRGGRESRNFSYSMLRWVTSIKDAKLKRIRGLSSSMQFQRLGLNEERAT